LVLPMSRSSVWGGHANAQRHPLAHIPGEDGWPIVGNTLAALKDPAAHIQATYRKSGPVYRDHLFGVRSVALLGPEANEFVLFDSGSTDRSSWSIRLADAGAKRIGHHGFFRSEHRDNPWRAAVAWLDG
jgi:hypothetical protein